MGVDGEITGGELRLTGIEEFQIPLPEHRYKAFVLLAKLAPFTPDEIEVARKINDGYRQRAIPLTARELEPYSMYERTKTEFDITGHAGTPDDLAEATARIYFRTPAPS